MFLTQLKYPKEFNKQTPVIVTLHGMGSNYHDLQPVAELIDATSIRIHIQADISFGNGYAFFVPDFSQKTEEEVILPVLKNIHDFIEKKLADERLSENPLVFLGFSQGAMISMGITYLYPNWLSQALIFSARMPDFYKEIANNQFNKEKSETAMFISQGQTDPLFPLVIGRSYSKFAKEVINQVAYHEYPVGHGIHPQAIKEAKEFYQENK